MPEQYAAYCEVQECDWLDIAESEGEARILMVCHFVVKHPQRYHLLMGKDPDQSAHEYAAYIEKYKERI